MQTLSTLTNAKPGLYRPVLRTPFGVAELPVYLHNGNITQSIFQFEKDNQYRLKYERVE